MNRPLLKLTDAIPNGPFAPFLEKTDNRLESMCVFNSASSLRVPGVIVLTTFRSTGPLALLGSPICSPTAMLSPAAWQREQTKQGQPVLFGEIHPSQV